MSRGGAAYLTPQGPDTLTGALIFNNAAQAGGVNAAGKLSMGSGAPVNGNGNDGDVYLRTDGGAGTTIYQRRAGAWVGVV